MIRHKFGESYNRSQTEINVIHVNRENIFTTPFYDIELDLDNDKIIHECLELERNDPKGVQKSNFNGGWQSDAFDLSQIERGITPEIQKLASLTIELSNLMLKEYRSGYRIEYCDIGWWININRDVAYNVYHSHPGCSLIGLYYPKVPDLSPQEGIFTMLRSDPLIHNTAFADAPNMCQIDMKPQEKHLYIMPSIIPHYVTPHHDNEERISIAFNIGGVPIDDNNYR